MVSVVIAALSGTASIGTAGLMDALNKADLAPTLQAAAGAPAPRVFDVRLTGLDGGAVSCRNGVILQPDVAAADVAAPDLVVVPGLDDDLAASFDANRGWVPWLASWHADVITSGGATGLSPSGYRDAMACGPADRGQARATPGAATRGEGDGLR